MLTSSRAPKASPGDVSLSAPAAQPSETPLSAPPLQEVPLRLSPPNNRLVSTAVLHFRASVTYLMAPAHWQRPEETRRRAAGAPRTHGRHPPADRRAAPRSDAGRGTTLPRPNSPPFDSNGRAGAGDGAGKWRVRCRAAAAPGSGVLQEQGRYCRVPGDGRRRASRERKGWFCPDDALYRPVRAPLIRAGRNAENI